MKIKLAIKNRWTGKIIFEYETEDNTMLKTLKAAIAADSDLSDSDLSGSDLSGSDLDQIKYDFFGHMLMQKHEIPALREKLIGGEIDGTCYEGKCSCFMGTIATAAHVHYENLNLKPNAYSATEKWFTGLKPRDTPENSSLASITLGWIDEFLELIK